VDAPSASGFAGFRKFALPDGSIREDELEQSLYALGGKRWRFQPPADESRPVTNPMCCGRLLQYAEI